MSNLSLEWLKKHKCKKSGCFNFAVRGHSLCKGHLYGFPDRMDAEYIERLANYEEYLERKYSKKDEALIEGDD